jgi:hypothetical protein
MRACRRVADLLLSLLRFEALPRHSSRLEMVGVAQLVRAPDCGSGGRGFETRHPPHFSHDNRIVLCRVLNGCAGVADLLSTAGR